jgi:hypothetical protein
MGEVEEGIYRAIDEFGDCALVVCGIGGISVFGGRKRRFDGKKRWAMWSAKVLSPRRKPGKKGRLIQEVPLIGICGRSDTA